MAGIITFFIALFICAALHAQSKYLQIGGIASFYQHERTGLGGGADMNFQTKANVVLGAGFAVLSFAHDKADGTYIPLFGRIGYAIPAKSVVFTLHGDVGYGFYHLQHPLLGGKTSEKGGFYASPGVSLHLDSRLSPFLDVRYAVYNFATTFDSQSAYHQNNGLAISVGFCFLGKRR